LIADNRQMVGKLLVIALLMFGFGYALVPIYKAVCSALGINVLSLSELQTGAGPTGPVNGQVDLSRTVTIEFDANARGPWDFKPEQASVEVHPGQVTTVMYSFRNRQDRAMAVQASQDGIKPFVIASLRKGRWSPHVNVGYQFNGNSLLAGNFPKGSPYYDYLSSWIWTISFDPQVVQPFSSGFKGVRLEPGDSGEDHFFRVAMKLNNE